MLLSREEECKETQKSPLLSDQSPYSRGNKTLRPKDSVKLVNEKNTALEKDEVRHFRETFPIFFNVIILV